VPAQTPRTTFERAAVPVVFDALEIDSFPLVTEPLAARGEHLERLLHELHPGLQLVEQTADANFADDWLKFLPTIHGVVAKRAENRSVDARARLWGCTWLG
jgi:ATP-dependent DNA ligase